MPPKKGSKKPQKKKNQQNENEVRGGRTVLSAEECNNPSFYDFYRVQNIITSENETAFKETVVNQLPTVFRLNKCKPHWPVVVDQLTTQYGAYCKLRFDSPSTSIYEISFDDYLKVPGLKKWCEFMNRCGRIGFQELASMIPPMFLDVRPEHTVLDMCAAPGSKTVQTMLTQTTQQMIAERTEDPSKPIGLVDPRGTQGIVWGNDKDAGRACLALARNVTKADTPQALLTSLDANHLPPMMFKRAPGATDTEEAIEAANYRAAGCGDGERPLLFDRILCDVPCSGDGTLRKNQDIWKRWTVKDALDLHLIQFRVLLRGLRMLQPGGRLVYSTCSLSPIEDEAVVAAALRWYHEDVLNLHARQVSSQRHPENGDFAPFPTDIELGNKAPIRLLRPSPGQGEVPDWLKVEDGLTSWHVPLMPPRKPRVKKEALGVAETEKQHANEQSGCAGAGTDLEEATDAPEAKEDEEKKTPSGPLFFGGGLEYISGSLPSSGASMLKTKERVLNLHPRSSKAAIRYALDDLNAHNWIRATMMPPVDVSKDPDFWTRFEAEHLADKHAANGDEQYGEGEKTLDDVRKRNARLMAKMPKVFRDVETQIVHDLPKCMRLLPQANNTGGFFVAVFEKATSDETLIQSGSAEEAELIEHVEVRARLRREAFERVTASRAEEKEKKEEAAAAVRAAESVAAHGGASDEEDQLDDAEDTRVEEDENDDHDSDAEQEGEDREAAQGEEGVKKMDGVKRPRTIKARLAEAGYTSPLGCTETANRLKDTFLMRSHASQRRKSTFLTWRFDVFPVAHTRRNDALEACHAPEYFRTPLASANTETEPINSWTNLPALSNHVQLQGIRDFFGFSSCPATGLGTEVVAIAAATTTAPSSASPAANEASSCVEMSRLGGLSLLTYLDYRGDPQRVFASTKDVERTLLTTLLLGGGEAGDIETAGASTSVAGAKPVPAILQTGIRLFEHLREFCPQLPMRWRVSQQGAHLVAVCATKRKVWLTRAVGEQLLKAKSLSRQELTDAEAAGQAEGLLAMWDANELGSVVVCVVMTSEPVLAGVAKRSDGGEGVWVACMLVNSQVQVYADKEQVNGLNEVIAQQKEIESRG